MYLGRDQPRYPVSLYSRLAGCRPGYLGLCTSAQVPRCLASRPPGCHPGLVSLCVKAAQVPRVPDTRIANCRPKHLSLVTSAQARRSLDSSIADCRTSEPDSLIPILPVDALGTQGGGVNQGVSWISAASVQFMCVRVRTEHVRLHACVL